MFPWSLYSFSFYPLFPNNKTTCSIIRFKLKFAWSQKLLCHSLDPQDCMPLFPTFVCLFHLLFIVDEIIIIKKIIIFWNALGSVLCSLCFFFNKRLFSAVVLFSVFCFPPTNYLSFSFAFLFPLLSQCDGCPDVRVEAHGWVAGIASHRSVLWVNLHLYSAFSMWIYSNALYNT